MVGGKVSFSAIHMAPVPDWNEVSFHFLHCIYVHMLGTGQLKGSQGSAEYPPTKMAHTDQSSSVMQQPSSFATSTTLNPLHTAIIKVYGECQAPEGLHIVTVVRRLADKYSEQAIRSGNQWLLDEGYLYQTIDNDHAKNVMEG